VKFHIILPSIVNLYVDALSLHILQERAKNAGPDGLEDDDKAQMTEAASNFVLSSQIAEELFGTPEIVQNQLDAFSAQYQGDT